MVTDAQVLLLREKLAEGQPQVAAAAAARMSVRSARKWQKGSLPSEQRKPRHWRTRRDPLAAVWESEVVPLLGNGGEKPNAYELLRELASRRPGEVGPEQLRTLQRRLRADRY